ncbi:MAG: methyltransferase domain-containing protein [Chloroflexota bacterium]
MPGIDHFTILAPWYDRIISYKEDEELIKWAELPITGSLLDVGGGTGRVSRSFIDNVKNLIIIDVSFGMLRIAKEKGLSATCALGELLPYPSDSFGRVLIVDALHHCTNQQEVIRDTWRVLKPEGYLLIVEPNYDHFSGKFIRLFENVLLMKSKFLSDNAIIKLLLDHSKEIKLKHVKGNSWFKVKK